MNTTRNWLSEASKAEESALQPLDKILNVVAKEFNSLTITELIRTYNEILDLFMNYSESFRHANTEYNKDLEDIVNELCRIYNIKVNVMYVNVYSHTINEWGLIYWSFLHMTSILLTHAFSEHHIVDYMNFASIVYNIDMILPCQICIHHYRSIKSTPQVKDIVKELAFGNIITGVHRFHNLITQNIAEANHRPPPSPFLIVDFALRFQCIEQPETTIRSTKTYIRNFVDRQPTLHVILTILLSTYLKWPYALTSNHLKREIYTSHPSFKNVSLDLRGEHKRELNTHQLRYALCKSILVQFQGTGITHELIESKPLYKMALDNLYVKFPNVIESLIDERRQLLNDDDDSGEFSFGRSKILQMLQVSRAEQKHHV